MNTHLHLMESLIAYYRLKAEFNLIMINAFPWSSRDITHGDA